MGDELGVLVWGGVGCLLFLLGYICLLLSSTEGADSGIYCA